MAGLFCTFALIKAKDMTIVEEFKKEQAYNREHPLFAPFDDEEMGERLPGLFRAEIVDQNGHDCLNMVFDNGEHFVYDHLEETMYHVDRIPESFFIHKFLEKVIYDFMAEHMPRETLQHIYCVRNEVSVRGFIRLLPYREEGIVYLPNIMLPSRLRHQGLGLKLISDIYAVCKRCGYRLILSMMVGSFYERMVARGAKVIDFETVEIDDGTNFGRI